MPTDAADGPVAFLHDLQRYGIKTGFGRVEALLDAVGDPRGSFDVVRVGGTNGKGSVARMIAAALRHDGQRVGLYTSPHMTWLGERIRVGGEPMRRSAMAAFLDDARDAIDRLTDDGDPPTFFETVTAMALWQFARREVDTAVLEVGLGGRLDTTGVCDADVAAVTSVDLEHTEVLGESVEEIAWEIGHVIPPEGSVGTAATGDALAVLDEMADDRGAELRAVDREVGVDRLGDAAGLEQRVAVETSTRELELRTPLLGAHQARNAGVAVAALDALGVGDVAVRRGLHRVAPRGRFEVVDRDPVVVLDAAHNPAAARALAATLDERFSDRRIHGVVGVLADKDLPGIADALADRLDNAEAVAPASPRAETPGVVADALAARGVEVGCHASIGEGLEAALAEAATEDVVVVTGSLYTVAEARRRWTHGGVEKRYRSVDAARSGLERAGERGDPGESVHRTVRLGHLTADEVAVLSDAAPDTGCSVMSSRSDARLGRSATVAGSSAALAALAASLPAHLARRLEPPSSVGDTTVMGILNVTPDSFYDGGRYEDRHDAVSRAEAMVTAGADVVDVGGESTRPGADTVPVDEERERVVPVIEDIADLDARISIDTRNPGTAAAALDAGADLVNDVTGLEDPEMRRLVADRDCEVVVMDAVDVPVDPDAEPEYDDVVADVRDRLAETVLRARRAGVAPERITVDPGVGFGKGAEGDAAILRRVHEFRALGYPVLIGASRKSFLGALADREDADDRLAASVAAAVHAATNGASVVRVHDVAETVEALRVAEALDRDD